jgi:hypothetical protein
MRLPSDYLKLVGDGSHLLRSLGADLRTEAERRTERPELWLSVRDLAGLAERLASSNDSEWRNGYANILIGGQDFGVLDQLVAGDTDLPLQLTRDQVELLARLRGFLRQYCDREFELDEPAA